LIQFDLVKHQRVLGELKLEDDMGLVAMRLTTLLSPEKKGS